MSGLPIWLNVLLCVLAAIAGVQIGRRAHRRQPISDASHVLNHTPHLWLILLLPVALMAFHIVFDLNPDWEWRLPYVVQYFYGPVAWGVLLGCFTYFAGFGGVVFLITRHPRSLVLGAFMGLLFIFVQHLHKQATARIPPTFGPPVVSPLGLVRQSTKATCVPAAAASLLAVLGDPRSERELAELFETSVDGTAPAQIVMAMRRLGYRERTFNIDRDGLAGVGSPAVIFLAKNTHAVTLLRHDEHVIEIWDPARGLIRAPTALLGARLAGGHALEFQRSD